MSQRGFFVGVLKQAGVVHEHVDHRAEHQAEARGGKRPQRKPLEHFVHRDHQTAETEADIIPNMLAAGNFDELLPYLADVEAAHDAQPQK